MHEHSEPMLSVLVVEDEWLVRAVIVAYLEEAGCQVVEADSGESALAVLRAGEKVDIVCTDIRLAGHLNGWDVGEGARALRADIPVIYTSGYSIMPQRRVGNSLFFDKPYDASAILDACHRLVGRRDCSGKH